MKPQRQYNLDKMTDLTNKRKDIVECIKSAKSQEAKEAYEWQLSYLDAIVSARQQLALNLEPQDWAYSD